MFKDFYNTAMRNMMLFGRSAIKRRITSQHAPGLIGAFDTEAREAIIAQQAQIEALQRGLEVVLKYFDELSHSMEYATDRDRMRIRSEKLTQALEIKDPTSGDEPEVDESESNSAISTASEITDAQLLEELKKRNLVAFDQIAILALLLNVSTDEGQQTLTRMKRRLVEIRFGNPK